MQQLELARQGQFMFWTDSMSGIWEDSSKDKSTTQLDAGMKGVGIGLRGDAVGKAKKAVQ